MELILLLERLGIDAHEWSGMVKDFGLTFKNVAGKPTRFEQAPAGLSPPVAYVGYIEES